MASHGGPPPNPVAVALDRVGSGSIATAPYNCSTGNSGTCSAAMPYGTAVTLLASRQAYWSGACGGALGGREFLRVVEGHRVDGVWRAHDHG